MVEFDIQVSEITSNNNQLTGRSLTQTVTWLKLPRKEEFIGLDGTDYEVVAVKHYMLDKREDRIRIIVEVFASDFDFTSLIDESGWEKTGTW